jgi:hypothetical protein
VEPRDLAIALARGRIAIGLGFLLLPGITGRMWVGRDANRAGPKVFVRAMGARDVAMGLGIVIAFDRGTPVRGWLEAATLADLADFAATLIARDHIPSAAVPQALAMAGSSAALGAWLARTVDNPPAALEGQTPESALTGHPDQDDEIAA